MIAINRNVQHDKSQYGLKFETIQQYEQPAD